MVKARTYVYKNREVTIKDIAELKKVSRRIIGQLMEAIKPGSDVTNFVDNYTPVYHNRVFIYMDRKVTCLDLARITGYTKSTISGVLRGVKPNNDVTAVINGITLTYKKRSFYVHGELIKEADIHKKYNLNYSTLHGKFLDVEDGADVTSIVDDLVDRVSIRQQSTEYLLNLTGDKSVGGTGIEWCNKSAFAFLGYPTRKGISYITKEVLLRTNYEGRKALGFDKACRSKWLTDNLWIYECPDCGKHLVLTTDEIINHKHGDMCNTCSTEEIIEERSY